MKNKYGVFVENIPYPPNIRDLVNFSKKTFPSSKPFETYYIMMNNGNISKLVLICETNEELTMKG